MADRIGGTLAAAVLSRLRAASATGSAPLLGIFIPATRQQGVPRGKMSSVYCICPAQRGKGISRQVPRFDETVTLHIDGFIAQGRSATTDLDLAADALIQAILNLLLEDESFIALFGFVESMSSEYADVETGKEAEEFDVVEFHIVLELGGLFTQYQPTAGVPLTTITTAATPVIDPGTPRHPGTPGDVTIDSTLTPAQE